MWTKRVPGGRDSALIRPPRRPQANPIVGKELWQLASTYRHADQRIDVLGIERERR